MFCPKCGVEFQAGVVQCSDCGVALVTNKPEAGTPEWEDLATVLSSSDPAVLAVAKSLLEAEGIPYVAQGEGLQDLFALGRLGGFNPISGPVAIQVPRASEEEARQLLAELEQE